MSLQIRTAVYRGQEGFTISGAKPGSTQRVKIFTKTRNSAERIRDKVKAGQEIELADFQQ